MNDRLKRLKLPAFGFALGVFAGAASPCEQAALEAEKAFDVPAGLLSAIGRVESGRFDAQEGRIVPWPWTIDVAGDGRQFDTAMEVVRTTQWLRDKQALTSGQHIILEQVVHAVSPAAGAQAPPPEELLEDDEDAGPGPAPVLLAALPAPQGGPHFCAAQVTKAWVVAS